VVPDGGVVTLVYGDSDKFKTWIAGGLAVAIATGRPFLGRATGAPRAVLWIDFEMGEEEWRRRTYAIARGLGLPDGALPATVYYWQPPAGLSIADGGSPSGRTACTGSWSSTARPTTHPRAHPIPSQHPRDWEGLGFRTNGRQPAPQPRGVLVAEGALSEGHVRQLLRLERLHAPSAKCDGLSRPDGEEPDQILGMAEDTYLNSTAAWEDADMLLLVGYNLLRPEDQPPARLWCYPGKLLKACPHLPAPARAAACGAASRRSSAGRRPRAGPCPSGSSRRGGGPTAWWSTAWP
jgi:hypothetical protein